MPLNTRSCTNTSPSRSMILMYGARSLVAILEKVYDIAELMMSAVQYDSVHQQNTHGQRSIHGDHIH